MTLERFWDITCEAVWREDLSALAYYTAMASTVEDGEVRTCMLGSLVVELTMVVEDPS